MKKIIIILVIIGVGVLGFMLMSGTSDKVVNEPVDNNTTATTTEPIVTVDKTKTVLGTSVEGRNITAYHYGEGEKEIIFVGGIHGGYSWNTALLGYEMMDYFTNTPSIIPTSTKVTVIPVLNPDGLAKVAGTADKFTASQVSTSAELKIEGRFNANNVDLNRNFDCGWKNEGVWQSKKVSGGESAFSEPESLAIKQYVEKNKPTAVVVYYSAAGGVFASNCYNGVSTETLALTNTYAKASGYKAYESFDFYEISGDMVNWLAKNNITAISVLLSDHQNTELTKNKAGINAILKYYAN